MKSFDFYLAAAEIGMARNGHRGSRQDIARQAPPMIGNLKSRSAPLLLPGAMVDGCRLGHLPIAFDYADPGGDLEKVIVTLPDGAAYKPLPDLGGQKSGTAHLIQAVLLPPSGEEVRFTVQAMDRCGNLSNTLVGSFTSP